MESVQYTRILVSAFAALLAGAPAPANALAKVPMPARSRIGVSARLTHPSSTIRPAPPLPHTGTVDGHLLAINDFHGQIASTRSITVDGVKRPVGGAATLAALFRAYRAAHPNTLLVNAGDSVGASPPVSALFQDEPTVEFLNMSGFDVGTLGNHEFDDGVPELLRLWKGGSNPASRYYPRPFPGARFPVVCANVISTRTGKTLLPPYVVKRVGGVRVGFIGAVTGDLPNLTSAASTRGTRLLDPVEAVNHWARHLERYGVHAIFVLMHEGGSQKPETPEGTLTGPIVDVARRLDKDVDVVVSAHSHQYTDAFVGRTLVTQARSYGEAFGEVDFTLDRASADIVRKRARILPAYQDSVTPAPDVAAMVKVYQDLSAPRINKVVAQTAREMPRSGRESILGDLIADAQRAATGSDIAMMNPGGIRADLPAGPVTWGQVYAVQPFGNQLVVMKMTGAQIRSVLEQQWGPGSGGEPREITLLVSGLSYTYDPQAPLGHRVVALTGADGQPLDEARAYTVTANNFLANGGDGFSLFLDAKARENGPNDLDALIEYLSSHPGVEPEMGRARAMPGAHSGGTQ